MTTPITTTTSNSQMHNDIMAAGSRERPSMLSPGHYAQWSSRFMRYLDTKSNKNELRHCIEQGPYILTEIVHEEVLATEEQPVQPLDACSTTREIWLAIERLQQDGESIESYYSKFYKMINDMVRNKLKVNNMQQYKNEVNEIRAKKFARNANPLALVVTAQHYPDDHYQAPKSYKTHAPSSRQIHLSRSHAPTRTKGKEIAKLVTPPSESAFEDKDNDIEQAERDKDMQENLALIAKYFKNIYKPTNNNLRTSLNTLETRQWILLQDLGMINNLDSLGIKGQKPKWAKDYAYHKEKMMMCKQEEKGMPLSAKQGDWLADTDDEPDEQELEAHYMYMAKIQEVPTTDSGPSNDVEPLEKVHSDDDYNVFATKIHHSEQPGSINDTYVVETVDSNVIPDSSDMCDNEGQVDQNAEEPEDERLLLASLIANLKLDIDENKKSQKQLKKVNTSAWKTKQDLALSKQNLIHCKSGLAKCKFFQTNQNDKEKA
ncbi:hypothetical protein Tco_0005006 [Tanacetum coccineum]